MMELETSSGCFIRSASPAAQFPPQVHHEGPSRIPHSCLFPLTSHLATPLPVTCPCHGAWLGTP